MYYQAQNQFGLTFDQVRKMFPSKSFPADGQIDTPEVSSYAPAPTPQYNPATHAVREAAPVGGVQQWEVYPLPAEEVAANQAAATQALRQSIVDATQHRLDDFARTRNYDDILSACTYATSAVPKFAAEGQYAVQARDATWAALYQFMADVQAGTQPVPSGFEDVEPLLPARSGRCEDLSHAKPDRSRSAAERPSRRDG
jgi:hypothetical protein